MSRSCSELASATDVLVDGSRSSAAGEDEGEGEQLAEGAACGRAAFGSSVAVRCSTFATAASGHETTDSDTGRLHSLSDVTCSDSRWSTPGLT